MKLRVAASSELGEREAEKFLFLHGDHTMSGIVARHDGRIVAYMNRCQHRPLPLDWDDGEFYDRERRYFICRLHGAAYEPATGLCVAGPCAGDSLERLVATIDGGDVFVELSIDG